MSLQAISSITRKIKETQEAILEIDNCGDADSIISVFAKEELVRRLVSLKEEYNKILEAQAKERISIRMYGENVEYGKISNRVLLSVLGGFQSIIDSIASTTEGSSANKGKIKRNAREIADFNVCGTFAGSFGIILEKDCGQHEVADKFQKTDLVVRNFFSVLENSTDAERLIRFISPYGKRTILHYREWLKQLKDSAVNLEMSWTDEAAEERVLNVKYSKADDIIYTLDSIEDIVNEDVVIFGTLTGINIRRNTFEMATDEGVIKGISTLETLIKISDKIGQKINANMIKSILKSPEFVLKTMWYLSDLNEGNE